MKYLKIGIVLGFCIAFVNAWSMNNRMIGKVAIFLSALLFVAYNALRYLFSVPDNTKGEASRFLDISSVLLGLISLIIAPFMSIY